MAKIGVYALLNTKYALIYVNSAEIDKRLGIIALHRCDIGTVGRPENPLEDLPKSCCGFDEILQWI
ncbi:MAG: hypothetical protein IJ219_06575 [Bacteroidaceae bacterium]|nr:hypothetical protein [Bacteroidaceae bacterium]MBQ9294576.1 hypothetical protein [Bacteroidaceae bacterium]